MMNKTEPRADSAPFHRASRPGEILSVGDAGLVVRGREDFLQQEREERTRPAQTVCEMCPQENSSHTVGRWEGFACPANQRLLWPWLRGEGDG